LLTESGVTEFYGKLTQIFEQFKGVINTVC